MTFALGWCLSQVPEFLNAIGKCLGETNLDTSDTTISLQEWGANTGITDIEIYIPGRVAWIVEAKQGFNVPRTNQLTTYARRLKGLPDRQAKRMLVVLAQSDRKEIWLPAQVPAKVDGIPVKTLSWREIRRCARKAIANSGIVARHLLIPFIRYLGEVAQMKDETSNMAYVVSLGWQTFGGGKITFRDVVQKYQKYFHPIGGGPGGWPSNPPNYIAFRYDAHLQSIHHIENYEVIDSFFPHFPGTSSKKHEPLFLYHLGPPIRPAKPIPTGANWRAIRVYCYIDTLLTSRTIVEALNKTRARTQKMSE